MNKLKIDGFKLLNRLISIAIVLFIPSPSGFAESICGSSINGINLGSSLEEVKLVFGEPVLTLELEGYAIGAEDYEYKLKYNGIEFYFVEKKLELITISNSEFQLGNGNRVGQSMESSYSAQISNSDCFVNYLVKEQVVEKIKIYCTN